MEIERKWMVSGWPALDEYALPLIGTEYQEQGYVHTQAPIVRVRLEARSDDKYGEVPAVHDDDALAVHDEDAQAMRDGGALAVHDGGAHAEHGGDSPANSVGSVTQAVRESIPDENARHILCFKSAGFLSREEIEIEISREDFAKLSGLIGQPLIRKARRIYQLPEDLELEVNLVDEGLPTEFMYAEVEFKDEAQARAWDPAGCGLGDYLADDVTELPGQSMSAFWAQTRGGGAQV